MFKLLTFTLLLVTTFRLVLSIVVVPEKFDLEYYNPKYIKYAHVDIRKPSLKSPYYIDFVIITICEFGDNVTTNMKLLEYFDKKYQPLPLHVSFKLCDFLNNEPFLGQMIGKQLPKNWTCPFEANEYRFENLVIHMENLPINLPFSWDSSLTARSRVDVDTYVTGTKELMARFKVYSTVKQNRAQKVDKKKKKGQIMKSS